MITLQQDFRRENKRVSDSVGRLCNKAQLTRDEEQALAVRAQEGDTEAMNALVEHNMRFVVYCATSIMGSNLDLDDAISTGALGALEAARRYKPGKPGRFISYAVHYIRRWIMNEYLLTGNPVRLPQNYTISTRDLREAYIDYETRYGHRPGAKDLEFVTGSLAFAEASLVAMAQHQSANLEIGEGRNKMEWHEMREHPGPGPDVLAEANSERDMINRAMSILTERERDILIRRCGIDQEKPESLDQIAGVYGLSREGIRQIQERALTKVRTKLGVKVPKDKKFKKRVLGLRYA